jgi:hypothetical protein
VTGVLVTIDVPPFVLAALKRQVEKYRRLKADEDASGRASFDLLSLEDAFGAYRDVLELIVDASPQH